MDPQPNFLLNLLHFLFSIFSGIYDLDPLRGKLFLQKENDPPTNIPSMYKTSSKSWVCISFSFTKHLWINPYSLHLSYPSVKLLAAIGRFDRSEVTRITDYSILNLLLVLTLSWTFFLLMAPVKVLYLLCSLLLSTSWSVLGLSYVTLHAVLCLPFQETSNNTTSWYLWTYLFQDTLQVVQNLRMLESLT